MKRSQNQNNASIFYKYIYFLFYFIKNLCRLCEINCSQIAQIITSFIFSDFSSSSIFVYFICLFVYFFIFLKIAISVIAFTSPWKKYFFLAFLEGGCFISKVYQGHCDTLCKVSTKMDKYNRNESKISETNKVLFEKSFLKVGL